MRAEPEVVDDSTKTASSRQNRTDPHTNSQRLTCCIEHAKLNLDTNLSTQKGKCEQSSLLFETESFWDKENRSLQWSEWI